MFKNLFISILFLNSFVAQALTPEVQKLVDWETKSNAAAVRSNAALQIEHYEVPLEILETSFEQNLSKEVKNSIVFNKNGKQFVRWIINPEDTKWHLEFENFLKSKNVSTQKHKHYIGYQTASRSYIVEDPITRVQFSLKVSTNKTGGQWQDKKQTMKNGIAIRQVSSYVNSVLENTTLKHTIVMTEPAMIGSSVIDQAMVIRDLAGLNSTGTYYLPGFSAMHSETGRAIALQNGSTNPAEFWRKNYAEPLGKALAEFHAIFGLAFDSPHSQNFLIELDKNLKPTGKIVLRDLGDVDVQGDYFDSIGRNDIVKSVDADQVIKGKFMSEVGILHGNKAPSWMSHDIYSHWAVTFHAAFEAEFSSITGIPINQLSKVQRITQRYSYSTKNYPINTVEMKNFITNARCLHGLPVALPGECPQALASRLKPNAPMLKNCQLAVTRAL